MNNVLVNNVLVNNVLVNNVLVNNVLVNNGQGGVVRAPGAALSEGHLPRIRPAVSTTTTNSASEMARTPRNENT